KLFYTSSMNRIIVIFLLSLFWNVFCIPKSFFIVSGEASGDRLGAWYIKNYTCNNDSIYATGGHFLADSGVKLLMTLDEIEKHNLRLLNCTNPFELISKIKKIYQFVQSITQEIIAIKCTEIILIDFPF